MSADHGLFPPHKRDEINGPPKTFDLDAYLRQREQDPKFVMIEIGHGGNPAIIEQSFKGKRAYVGIESWQRHKSRFDKIWPQTLAQIRLRTEENIFFHDYDTGYRSGDEYQTDAFGVHSGSYEEGRVETIFPAGAADEVYLSNVFGDPQIGSEGNTNMLLAEIHRLVTNDGKVVINETQTPEKSLLTLMDAQAFEVRGFKLEAKLSVSDKSTEWKTLEAVYSNSTSGWHDENSYFIILSKIPKVVPAR